MDDRARGQRCQARHRAGPGGGLHLGPIIRDPYQAAADAGLSDDDIAYIARLYR
ncbi:MAG: hypothetical protein ABSB68_02730 [Acidimicrobiales bacterium]